MAGIETILIELVEKGGGWGLVAAMLFVFWRMYNKIEPHIRKHLDLKEREVKAREAIPAQVEKTQTGQEKLSTAVADLAHTGNRLVAEIERVRKNGAKDRVSG